MRSNERLQREGGYQKWRQLSDGLREQLLEPDVLRRLMRRGWALGVLLGLALISLVICLWSKLFQSAANTLGHQLGWWSAQAIIRIFSRRFDREWVLYLPSYGGVFGLLWLFGEYPSARPWGLGRFISGFAASGSWTLMEGFLHRQVLPQRRARVFSFYVVIYHIFGLVAQLFLGTSAFHYRPNHLWGSMTAGLICPTVLPRLFIWHEGWWEDEEGEAGWWRNPGRATQRVRRRLGGWLKSKWIGIGEGWRARRADSEIRQGKLDRVLTRLRVVLRWLHRQAFGSSRWLGEASLALGMLSAACPIYLRRALLSKRDQALHGGLNLSAGWMLCALFFGGTLGRLLKSVFQRRPPAKRLLLALYGISFSSLGLLYFHSRVAMALNLVFLGAASHQLYPALLLRLQEFHQGKEVRELWDSLNHCLLVAGLGFMVLNPFLTGLGRVLKIGPLSSEGQDDFLYFFLNGYLFLFAFALLPRESERIVSEGKKRALGWVVEKNKDKLQRLKSRLHPERWRGQAPFSPSKGRGPEV